MRSRSPIFPDSANHPSLALRGAESCAGSSCFGFCSFGGELRPRNDESPAWRPGLSKFLGLLGESKSQFETPSISQDRQLKNAVFESGGAWPFDSLRQDGPTQPQGTAMEPQFAYDYESCPRDPIRRHSRLRGRCEGVFWRPFKGEDAKRYMQAAERYERDRRETGCRNGPLGPVGLEVLRELVRLVDYRTGRLEPAITTLMRRLKRSRDAVCRALANLRRHGFLDWLRRFEPAPGRGEKGPQVRQVTNAYRLSLPPAAERLLGLRFIASPPPEDHEHAEQAHRAAVKAMIAALPLGEQAQACGATGGLLGALARLGEGLMKKERESAVRTESPLRDLYTPLNVPHGTGGAA